MMFKSIKNIGHRKQRQDHRRRQEQSPELSELCRGVGIVEGRSVFVVSEEGEDVKLPTPVIKGGYRKHGGRFRLSLKKKNEEKKLGGISFEKGQLALNKLGTAGTTDHETKNVRPAHVLWCFFSTEEKQAIVRNTLTDADLKQLQDYFNFQKKGFYLPPLHNQPWVQEGLPQKAIKAHKTYTTRKGALLLYAEDLAHSFPSQRKRKRKKSLEAEDRASFNTMNDLRSAILSYGAKEEDDKVFVGFTNAKTNKFNSTRSVRPGFSAKRYLANWSKSWDDSILNYLRNEGHLWDRNMFDGSSAVPMYRRINDDISDVPKPYCVSTRSMLVSGGPDKVSYEFYRIRPDDMEYGSGEASEASLQPHPPTAATESKLAHPGMIATIARDANRVPHPVMYSQLHPEDQQTVLKKLMLQGIAYQSQQGDVPEDMGEAIVNLVSENSKSILSGGKAFAMKNSLAEEPSSRSSLSGSSWPEVVEQVAPQLSSVPTLPPINVQTQPTGENEAQRPWNQKGDVTLPDINQGVGVACQSSSEHGGEDFLVSSQLHQSLEDLNQADEQQTTMKGGCVPKNRTESMRSYKSGSVRSAADHSSASDVSADDELSVVGSVISLASGDKDDLQSNQALNQDGNKEVKQGPDPVTNEDEHITLPSVEYDATLQTSSEIPGDVASIESVDGDDSNRDEDIQPDKQRTSSPGNHGLDTERTFPDGPSQGGPESRSLDGSKEISTKSEVGTSETELTNDDAEGLIPSEVHSDGNTTSYHLSKDERIPEPAVDVTEENINTEIDASHQLSAEDQAIYEAGCSQDKVPSSDQEDPGNSQPLPIASVGSDLTEEAVKRHSENFPKPKKKLSISSTASAPQSLRSVTDEGSKSLTPSELFNNFSYAGRRESDQGSRPSRRESMQTSLASDEDEAEIGTLAEDSRTSWAEEELREQGESVPLVTPITSPTDHLTDLNDVAVLGDASTADEMGARPSKETGLEDNDLLDNNSRKSSSSALSLMSQLEDEAAAIAETVINWEGERPRPGRDLAEDAQLAAALWKDRLDELFQDRRPEDTQSLILRHRRDSLDESAVSSLDLGRKGPKQVGLRSRRHRKVTSAHATVDVQDPASTSTSKTSDGSPQRDGQAVDPEDVEDDPLTLPQGSLVGEDTKVVPPAVTGGVPKNESEKNPDMDRKEIENSEDSELQKIIADAGLLSQGKASPTNKKSKVGQKSSKIEKSEKSSRKSSEKSVKHDVEKVKDFIVGLPHDERVDYLADQKTVEPVTEKKAETGKAKTIIPKPPKKPKKEKKKKDKTKMMKKSDTEESPVKEDSDSKREATLPDQPKDVSEAANENPESTQEDEQISGTKEHTSEEAESPEFIIVHEEFSDSEPDIEPEKPAVGDELPSSSFLDSQDEGPSTSDIGTDFDTEDSSSQGPDSLSKSRAAKRAAESERKRREVERKRLAKEEARRKAQEEELRKERIKQEYEEERLRKREEMRMKQEAEKEAQRMAEESARERQRREELAAERERKQQEEYKRKLEALAKHKREEDKQRQELEAQRLREEEERQREEAEMMAKMAEEERIEYERRKREEALIAQIKADEERMRREVEAQLAQEEAQRLALEMARRQREMERRLRFNRELQSEANVMAHSQDVTRAFTWSYFELLEYLGIPIPDNMREKYLKGQLLPNQRNHHSADVGSDP